MFIILLKFAENGARASDLLAGHRAWIQRGIDDGVFALVGSLAPTKGGAILAHRTTRSELEERVGSDPFVAENVVRAEVLEVAPSLVDPRLEFLRG